MGTVTVATKAPPWPPVTRWSTGVGVSRTSPTSWQRPVKPLTTTDPPAAVRSGETVPIPSGGSCSTTKVQLAAGGLQPPTQSHPCAARGGLVRDREGDPQHGARRVARARPGGCPAGGDGGAVPVDDNLLGPTAGHRPGDVDGRARPAGQRGDRGGAGRLGQDDDREGEAHQRGDDPRHDAITRTLLFALLTTKGAWFVASDTYRWRGHAPRWGQRRKRKERCVSAADATGRRASGGLGRNQDASWEQRALTRSGSSGPWRPDGPLANGHNREAAALRAEADRLLTWPSSHRAGARARRAAPSGLATSSRQLPRGGLVLRYATLEEVQARLPDLVATVDEQLLPGDRRRVSADEIHGASRRPRSSRPR